MPSLETKPQTTCFVSLYLLNIDFAKEKVCTNFLRVCNCTRVVHGPVMAIV